MAEKYADARGATSPIDVYVKLPSGRTFRMDMRGCNTIKEICQRVAKEENVPEERVNMKYTGKVLKKSSTLGYLGVCAETILKAEILQIKNYDIFVRLPDGRTLSLNVENVSPISYLKDQIHLQTDVEPQNQLLRNRGNILVNPKRSILAAGLANEAIVTLEIIENSEKSSKPKSKTRSGSLSDDTSSCTEDEGELTVKKPNAPESGELDKDAVLNTFDAAGKPVEVIFSFDTTGSMYSCLQEVRNNLKSTVERLLSEIPLIRIGIMAHGDYCDHNKYVVRTVDLTSDAQELVSFVESVPATSGGDSPECYEWILYKACHMDWSENSAKALVVIGDDVPHPVSYTDQEINWHDQLDLLTGMGVKVYGVRAQNSSSATPFYKELAYRTGGAYIEFKNFSIITEMFMAVCYREASDEQFEAFCEEVGSEECEDQVQSHNPEVPAAKVKDIQAVLSQLKEQKDTTPQNKLKHYVASPWWDPDLDYGSLSYSYNAARDKWSKYINQRVESTSRPTASSPPGVSSTSVPHVITSVSKTKSRQRISFRSRKSYSNHTHSGNKKGCTVM